jgi:hypothetical protein
MINIEILQNKNYTRKLVINPFNIDKMKEQI